VRTKRVYARAISRVFVKTAIARSNFKAGRVISRNNWQLRTNVRTYVCTLPCACNRKNQFCTTFDVNSNEAAGPSEIPMLNPEYRNQPRDVKFEISDWHVQISRDASAAMGVTWFHVTRPCYHARSKICIRSAPCSHVRLGKARGARCVGA